ncbi:MAG: serine protease [Oscillatoria sp. PMC 1068.18]|nr:serine protease [Oscillatoria sp. PMC 1076.18]MEC4987881.1 serine protease [Oscillatoria sp. PMC 1068.18]
MPQSWWENQVKIMQNPTRKVGTMLKKGLFPFSVLLSCAIAYSSEALSKSSPANLTVVSNAENLLAQPMSVNYPPANGAIEQSPPPLRAIAQIQYLTQITTVRIIASKASGSGVIVHQTGQIYTVLTNWHVVSFSDRFSILTPDGQQYQLTQPPQRLGNTDMAILKFQSNLPYKIAPITQQPISVGEPVFASGFPMYYQGTLVPTFDEGIEAFRFTQGKVSLLPPKAFSQGYRLGYTNDIEVGMSGGPIFNLQGQLIGINGRTKYRDPDFGVYEFEDGTEPSAAMLDRMVASSWGIPITTYLNFVSAGN